MQSTPWVRARRGEDAHWATRRCIPTTAIALWVAGLVVTACGLFGLGLIGR